MICTYCGSKMKKVDVNFGRGGNKDVYWLCDKCAAEGLEQFRRGRCVWIECVQSETSVMAQKHDEED